MAKYSHVSCIGIPHYSMQDDEYNGHIIPANSLMIANIWYVPSSVTVRNFINDPRPKGAWLETQETSQSPRHSILNALTHQYGQLTWNQICLMTPRASYLALDAGKRSCDKSILVLLTHHLVENVRHRTLRTGTFSWSLQTFSLPWTSLKLMMITVSRFTPSTYANQVSCSKFLCQPQSFIV